MPTYSRLKNECRACGLCEERATVVRGMGSLTADVLVVGSYPDEVSERRNEPFNEDGIEGKHLDWVREKLCLDWEDIRVTYAVACRPSERVPRKSEIDACRYWLTKEESAMTAARLERDNHVEGGDFLVHPVLLTIGNDAAHAVGLLPYGAPAIEVCGRWFGGVKPFRNNAIFCLQGFETLKEPVIPTIREEWAEHLTVLLRGLQIRDIGRDLGRPLLPEYAKIQNDPFAS